MPNNDQTLDLEKLKTDPKMWMRLATPLDGSNVLKHVFSGTENPFEKNSEAAMEKLRKLAAEGQLYMREFGRSRHFQKVEPEGDKLKLGQQHEMKVSRSYSDPVLGGLMYASRAYFKWIGLESVSKWFDKRLERRDALIEKDKQYDEEYKSLTKEQKKELTQRRSQEKKEAKARQRLEKAEKELAKAREELNQIQGKNTASDKGELNAPLTQPPKQEEKSSMQPTLEGDQPQLQKQQEALTREEKQPEKDEKIQKRENPSAPANATEEKKKGIYLVSGDKVYTDENLNELPEEVRKMLEMIQKVIEQMETQKQQEQVANEQPQPRPEEQLEQVANEQPQPRPEEQVANVPPQPEPEVQLENPNADDILPKFHEEEPIAPKKTVEMQEEDLQPMFHDVEKEPKAETNVPLNQPAEIEPEQVDIQPEPERLEQEEIPENEKTVPEDWRDVLVRALFSHENGGDLLAQYQQVKDNPLDSAVFLASAIFGVLKENIIDREPNQNLLEQIFNGRSLGNGNDDLIRSGMESAQDAMRKGEEQEDLQPLEEMLTIAVRELKEYAGDGNEPTPQQAMAAMMAELAEGFARDFGVQLPQEETIQQDAQPKVETNVPLNQPAEIEPEQVDIQPEPERLEQEEIPENEKAVPEDWRDVLVSALFSHQKGSDMLAQYQEIKDDPLAGMLFLADAVFGLLKQNITGPESNQQLMEEIFSGRSLGDDRDDLIRAGLDTAKDVLTESFAENNSKPLEEMLTTAVRELKEFAGDGNNRTPQQELAGMMIEMAEEMAKDHGLQLPQEEAVQQDSQPQAETNVPLNQPAEIEPEQVDIQPEPKLLEQPEQIREEKQETAQPEDWRDVLVSALFSHQKGSDMLAQYQEIKDDPLAGMLFLADAVFGLLKQNITGPESNHQLMEEIFSGRSLGDDRDDLIRAGLDTAKDALTESFAENNTKPLEEMLTTAVRELKEFAGDGNNRTPQQELAGMMIEMAEEMAKDHGLQLPQEEAVQQMGDQKPQAQQEAALEVPLDLEQDKIKIQERQPDQKPLTFPERLEAEKQALEATKHWRDTVSNSLFSHQGGEDLMNSFNQMRSHPRDASNFLTTAVLGLITNGPQKNGGEKNHQQMLDALLDGRPLGAENDNFIRGAANRAKDLMQNDDPEKMKNLLGDAVRGLGWQATQEPELSVRHVMIGMLISAAMTMAGQRGLNLGLNATDTRLVQCASEMGKIALNYENARQYFANNPLDHTNETCRTQLQNLLAGNAVDKSIELDRSKGQTGVTNTHTLMGGGVWTEANLRTMSQSSRVRSGITQDQLQQMLEDPHGKIAHKAGHSVGKEMISGAQDLMSGKTHSVQLERTVEQDQMGPEKQPMQFMG